MHIHLASGIASAFAVDGYSPRNCLATFPFPLVIESASRAAPANNVRLAHCFAISAMASPIVSDRTVENAKSRAFGDLVADFARSVFDYLVRALKIEPK